MAKIGYSAGVPQIGIYDYYASGEQAFPGMATVNTCLPELLTRKEIKMIKTEERWIEREGKQKNYFRIWHPDKPAVGIVLLLTGMVEHVRRYDAFARFLTEHGFLVAAGDHRSQGQTGLKNGRLGALEKGGFRRIIMDQKYYVDMLRREHPGLPIFLIGHSWGSLMCQKFIQKYSDSIDGVVLLGSFKQERSKIWAGQIFLRLIMLVTGEYFNSKLANDLAFLSNNKKFENEFSKFAWLCSDLNEVRRYEQDPMCGYLVSNNFLYELSGAILQLYHSEQLRQIRKDLPLLLISGGADPLGGNGRWVMDLYLMYKKLGIEGVQLKLYDQMRHEVLHEKGKEEVFAKILAFLQKNITV